LTFSVIAGAVKLIFKAIFPGIGNFFRMTDEVIAKLLGE